MFVAFHLTNLKILLPDKPVTVHCPFITRIQVSDIKAEIELGNPLLTFIRDTFFPRRVRCPQENSQFGRLMSAFAFDHVPYLGPIV